MEVEKLAKLFKLHPDSVRRSIRNGEIKATKEGRSWIVDDDEVERLKAKYINNDVVEELLKENESLKAELKRIKSILKDLAK